MSKDTKNDVPSKGVEPEVVKSRAYPLTLDDAWAMMERKDLDKFEELGGQEGLIAALRSDPNNGVEAHTLEQRRDEFGWNKLSEPPKVSFFELVWAALQDKIVLMLIAASVISIIFGMTLSDPHTGEVNRTTGWIEGFAIIVSVNVVVLVSSVNDYQKAKKFEEMRKEQKKKEVQVIRDGEQHTIDAIDVVVGDVLLVEGGMNIVADAIFLDGQDLKCNESAMTGESDVMKKNAKKDPFFISGADIEEGSGTALVVAVGMSSFQGRMQESTDSGGQEETPLQAHLSDLADKIGKLGMICALLIVIIMSIKEVIFITTRDNHDFNISTFLRFIITATTVVVVAIPEGLPLAVTIALAYSMKSMMEDNCLVRILASCETMGAATGICSDKTGTLTTNIMTVVQGHMFEEDFLFEGYGLVPRSAEVNEQSGKGRCEFKSQPDLLRKLCYAVAINSTAHEQIVDGQKVWVGNKTEHGLLGFLEPAGHDYTEIRNSVSNTDKRQYPFDSKKKHMTTLVRGADGKVNLYCKGASEMVLADCDRYINAAGEEMPIDEHKREELEEIIADMANQGNRTIAMASCPVDDSSFPDEEPQITTMVFLGVLGIQDPIRSAVPDAVRRCNSAGLVIRMVTGDNINTAIAIAKKCGIYQDNGWDYAMTGPEFRKMYTSNKAQLMDLVPRLRVLARSSPRDKYDLVQLLQSLGEVIGVTGDGTNDAPALKMSNVGFAMNTGTDIAKGAAHMILMDDNFATVVAAIKWGRSVNDNIRKFLQFQLSVNVAGVLLTLVGGIISEKNAEPLKPVHLLWLNLIMDTLAAISLATERPEERSLDRMPVFQQAPILSYRMRFFIGCHATLQMILSLLLIFFGHEWFQTEESQESCKDNGGEWDGRICKEGLRHGTVIFNTFIFFQVFNQFNARKLYGEWNIFEGLMTRAKPTIAVFLITCAFQAFAVEVGAQFMASSTLTWKQWLGTIGIGFAEFPFGVFVRLMPFANYIPPEVQEKWDREDQMRRELGVDDRITSVAALMHRTQSMLVDAKDPSLGRRNNNNGMGPRRQTMKRQDPQEKLLLEIREMRTVSEELKVLAQSQDTMLKEMRAELQALKSMHSRGDGNSLS